AQLHERHAQLSLAALEERAELHGELLALVRRQRPLHRLPERRHVRIPGGVEETVPASRLNRLDAGVELSRIGKKPVSSASCSRSRSSTSSIGSLSGGW